MNKQLWSIIFVILLTATVSFLVGNLAGMNLPFYFYIVVVCIGFFLYTVMLVVTADGERDYKETQLKGRAK